MKNILIIFTVFLFGIALNSCNDSLLDIEQHGSLLPENYYANASDEQAEQLIAEVYSQAFVELFWNGFLNGISDDGVRTGGTFSNVNVTSQNHDGNGYFNTLFRINYLCNMIIENLPDDTNAKKQVIGEAYFWRAYAYSYLIRMWGTPPLIDHVMDASELTPSNGNVDELWAYVETSLDEAIKMLPEKPGLGQQRAIGGRVTVHSAYALLGKCQVMQGDYSNAITNLEKVISSGKYRLIDDFRELYHLPADFSDEYIWEFNVDDSNQQNFEREGDNRAVNLTWRTENVTVPGGFTAQGYGMADFGKGFYDFMVARGEKGLPRYLGTIWDYEDILDRFVELGLASDREEAKGEFWNSVPSMSDCQGYFRSKMLPWEDEMFDFYDVNIIHSKINWPGMRYAEVLLLYAEACVQSGTKTTEGLAAMNEIRFRAGLEDLSSYSLQDLKDEKRAEMAYEGERFLDLVRWGDAPTALANRGFNMYNFYGYTEGTTDYSVTETPVQDAVGFQSGRDELFPFPYNERLLNPNLDQNPNW
nr:RagB/SusD family nutrient uptake outer membrane protein [uncultured Carboxylicivirga sp.]